MTKKLVEYILPSGRVLRQTKGGLFKWTEEVRKNPLVPIHPKPGNVAPAAAGGGRNGGGGNGRCPYHLQAKFKAFEPRYSYAEGVRLVSLDKILFWNDTQEWAAMYKAQCYVVGQPDKRSIERFVWTFRDGHMKELRQFGVPNFWRASFEGWKG